MMDGRFPQPETLSTRQTLAAPAHKLYRFLMVDRVRLLSSP